MYIINSYIEICKKKNITLKFNAKCKIKNNIYEYSLFIIAN